MRPASTLACVAGSCEAQQERLAAEAEEQAVAEGAAELDAFIDGQTSVVGVDMPAGPGKKRKVKARCTNTSQKSN